MWKKCGYSGAILCALISFSFQATATEKVSRLTEDNVERFILRTTEVTSHKDPYLSSDDIKEYLEAHLHKKGFFKSEVRYIIPGFPNQENTLSLDKDQFIDSILNGQQALENYETQVVVEDIRVSKDGKKATLTTRGVEEGLMPVPSESGESEKIPVEGNSTCNQILKLEDHVIQMYSATCSTHINFSMSF